jgi:predicted transposase YdaD
MDDEMRQRKLIQEQIERAREEGERRRRAEGQLFALVTLELVTDFGRSGRRDFGRLVPSNRTWTTRCGSAS